jgi:thiamine kinase-like enzyme
MKINKFTNQQIIQTINQVTSRHQLIPEYIMSTSGELFVLSMKRKKQQYLLKIRKINEKFAQIKFKNEINILSNLKKKNIPGLILPTFITANTKQQPEYLLYSFIAGWPLNTFYIYIGKRLTPAFLKTDFLNIIKKIQTSKLSTKTLECYTFKKNFNTFLRHQNQLKKYISLTTFSKIKKTIQINKKLLDTAPLVLTHGDINPKNLIITKNKLSIIDWSDVHLNNPLYDLSMLYMFAWNRPEIMKKIKEFLIYSFPQIPNPDHLHLINRLILTPKMIGIMENSIKGIKKDKKNKIILAKTERELIFTAKLAIDNLISDAKKIIWYFEMCNQPIKSVKTINKLHNFNSARLFIHKNENILKIKRGWNLTKMEIHRLIIRTGDQKLIAEYTLQKGSSKKYLMAKIRIERGDDLAKQSYLILKSIWNCNAGKKLISRPLSYFPKENLFIYEKTLGHSLASLIEDNKITSHKKLINLIVKAAKLLYSLHSLPKQHFANTNFINNYDISEQLFWFENTLKNYSPINTKENFNLLNKLGQINNLYKSNKLTEKKFIHGDFQLQNLILNKNTIRLIDFDNAEINDPLIDVGNFINQINYKGLLSKQATALRIAFLNNYLHYAKIKINKEIIKKINFYIIMGIIKNINYNFLEGQNDLIRYDIKKINYLVSHLDIHPITNLKNSRKFLAKSF